MARAMKSIIIREKGRFGEEAEKNSTMKQER